LKCFGSWIAGLGLDEIELTEKMQVFQAMVIQECNMSSSTIEVDVGTNVVGVHLDKVDLVDSCVFKHCFYMHSPPQRTYPSRSALDCTAFAMS
jgi:hypothetical protein